MPGGYVWQDNNVPSVSTTSDWTTIKNWFYNTFGLTITRRKPTSPVGTDESLTAPISLGNHFFYINSEGYIDIEVSNTIAQIKFKDGDKTYLGAFTMGNNGKRYFSFGTDNSTWKLGNWTELNIAQYPGELYGFTNGDYTTLSNAFLGLDTSSSTTTEGQIDLDGYAHLTCMGPYQAGGQRMKIITYPRQAETGAQEGHYIFKEAQDYGNGDSSNSFAFWAMKNTPARVIYSNLTLESSETSNNVTIIGNDNEFYLYVDGHKRGPYYKKSDEKIVKVVRSRGYFNPNTSRLQWQATSGSTYADNSKLFYTRTYMYPQASGAPSYPPYQNVIESSVVVQNIDYSDSILVDGDLRGVYYSFQQWGGNSWLSISNVDIENNTYINSLFKKWSGVINIIPTYYGTYIQTGWDGVDNNTALSNMFWTRNIPSQTYKKLPKIQITINNLLMNKFDMNPSTNYETDFFPNNIEFYRSTSSPWLTRTTIKLPIINFNNLIQTSSDSSIGWWGISTSQSPEWLSQVTWRYYTNFSNGNNPCAVFIVPENWNS